MTGDAAERQPRVMLMGMMGSGKTTVGRAISARTDWPYIDNDEMVARMTGVDTEALSLRGADVLHRLQAESVLAALDRPEPYVAGLAGSVVADPEVRRRVRAEAFGVYLRASVRTLVGRVGEGPAGHGSSRTRGPR